MKIKSILTILLMTICLTILSGCSRSAAQSSTESELLFMRTPQPTFTPTVQSGAPQAPELAAAAQEITEKLDEPIDTEAVGGLQPSSENAPSASIEASIASAGSIAPLGPIAVVNSPVVNARKGPGLTYRIVGEVERGAELEIIGTNDFGDWWYLCCVNDTEVWIIEDLVDTVGFVDQVPVVQIIQSSGAVASISTPVPTPIPQAAVSSTTSQSETSLARGSSFDLQRQEQFPETNTVRIFVYVFEGEQALGGYGINVRHNGAVLPVEATSFGGQPGLTWPIADDRQRFQNMKVEFPDEPAGGTWEVQLVDANGNPVSEIVSFNLTNNEPNQELYLRYQRR